MIRYIYQSTVLVCDEPVMVIVYKFQYLYCYPPYNEYPRGDPGVFKSRMCPPYPHACRKRRRDIAKVADTALSTNLT